MEKSTSSSIFVEIPHNVVQYFMVVIAKKWQLDMVFLAIRWI
jgi:hypothetical protein